MQLQPNTPLQEGKYGKPAWRFVRLEYGNSKSMGKQLETTQQRRLERTNYKM